MIHGAKVFQVRGNFDEALEFVLKLGEKHKDIYLLNSINPFRIEGQKSLGYEICEQLNYEAPDRIVIPVGNAGNISASLERTNRIPRTRFNQERCLK
jgi:threonine synthase